MALPNRYADMHVHLCSAILFSVTTLALFASAECFAAAQNPPSIDNRESSQRTALDPQLAAVTLDNGSLTINANNSDLSQILRDVSHKSGMIIQGTVKDVRVFGSYGPQNPCDLLNQLLVGLGYNIIMVGVTREGAPRELMLTARTDRPSPAPPLKEPVKTPDPELGPGVISHPPPTPFVNPQTRAQQNLRRLQQMHESQERESAPESPNGYQR